MKTFNLLLITALTIMGGTCFAQDTIFKRNNDTIISKIQEISATEIKYYRFDLLEGPVFLIKKDEVVKIKYKNGVIDEFGKSINNEKPPIQTTETPEDLKPKYKLTMVDGTQLRGRIISETEKEIVFLDNNFGERKIARKSIRSLSKEHGSSIYIISLTDGSVITGKIISKSDNVTIVETNTMGVVSIPQSKIKLVRSIEEVTVTGEGKIWFKNPNCTRYLFAPSAIPLKKGEGYYQNIYGAGNAVNFGITNNITIGGGLVGPLGGYINTKLSLEAAKNLHIGIGGIFGNSFVAFNNGTLGFGLGFAVMTLGNFDHNITIGIGSGFVSYGGKKEFQDKPLFVANGMTRVGKKFALVTENWFFNKTTNVIGKSQYQSVITYAFRYMGQKTTLDAGFLNTPDLIRSGWFVGIPYIGFVIRFGNYLDN